MVALTLLSHLGPLFFNHLLEWPLHHNSLLLRFISSWCKNSAPSAYAHLQLELLKKQHALQSAHADLKKQTAELEDQVEQNSKHSIVLTKVQRDLGLNVETVTALTRDIQKVKVRTALSHLHASVLAGQSLDSADVAKGNTDFAACQPPLVWSARHLELWRSAFASSSIDTLSKQRHTSAHTFTAIELKAVIALGPFEDVTQDRLCAWKWYECRL